MIELRYQIEQEDSMFSEPLRSVIFVVEDGVILEELLLQMEGFIKAIGYYPKGKLIFVEEDDE